ncbi:hypothetical protein K461DRAFT_248090 [Myriangium duriaei CBS 260.36]|uniref:ABM domain-containing protein n=1 Tax=Myriangium duriaei CBS 260.36 TaxID=1168546 RepID=A0A9P4IRW7_9PEZI|nr:hypothetical protein K461DRAFT_248090 [Myriangium duriaei CBS 260.36]
MTEFPPVPEGEFCIFGVVYCKPEFADELEQMYSKMTKDTKSEPGTLYYAICRDDTDRTKFHFFERYAGKAAFEEHISKPETQTIHEKQMFRGVKAKFVTAIPAAGQ